MLMSGPLIVLGGPGRLQRRPTCYRAWGLEKEGNIETESRILEPCNILHFGSDGASEHFGP